MKGLPLGARTIRSRLHSPDLPPTERSFIEAISGVFLEPPPGEDMLFVGGAGHLVAGSARTTSIPGLDRLMSAVEERAAVTRLLRARLDERGVYLRIGHENEAVELLGASVVGANYGTHTRNLGSVNVIGPVRMDYPRAIATVRYAAAGSPTSIDVRRRPRARQMSDHARLLRGARHPANADENRDQEGLSRLARTHHPDVNDSPEAEEEFKEIAAAYEVLSDTRAPRDLRPLRPRGPAQQRRRARLQRLRRLLQHLSGLLRRRAPAASSAVAAAAAGRNVAPAGRRPGGRNDDRLSTR